jgi:hypothetical protein
MQITQIERIKKRKLEARGGKQEAGGRRRTQEEGS